MLEQVELKIQELQKVQAEEYYKKKEEDLRSWGLVSKKEGGKVTPLVVTDEEYDALIKASNGVGKSGRNSIAIVLNALSIAVIVVAAIAGFVLEALADELGFVYMSISFVIGIVFAAVLKGVAEAVRLLQQIVDDKPIRIPTEAARKTENAAKPVVPPCFSKKKLYATAITDMEMLLKNSLEPLARIRKNAEEDTLPLA